MKQVKAQIIILKALGQSSQKGRLTMIKCLDFFRLLPFICTKPRSNRPTVLYNSILTKSSEQQIACTCPVLCYTQPKTSVLKKEKEKKVKEEHAQRKHYHYASWKLTVYFVKFCVGSFFTFTHLNNSNRILNISRWSSVIWT